jgi:hypothetical protein
MGNEDKLTNGSSGRRSRAAAEPLEFRNGYHYPTEISRLKMNEIVILRFSGF